MSLQLDLEDIQGNVLAGFNTNIQLLLGFTASDVTTLPDAANWAASLAGSITSVADIRASRSAIKAATSDGPVWLAIGLGNRIFTTQPGAIIYDDAFLTGMPIRAPSVLGDFTDPRTWTVGSPDHPLDILLIVASNDEDAVQRQGQALVDTARSARLLCTYREVGRRINSSEHFGFRDGVSQPGVAGYDEDADVPATKFLLGISDGESTPLSSAIDPGGLTTNGSFLVFRRLAQDVRKFQTFCATEAARLAPKWPGLTASRLAAMLVGRWPSGTPTDMSIPSDPNTSPPTNSFDFSTDNEGRVCPLGAHIRKVNPRKGPRDEVRPPRIIRRGIPFGPEFYKQPDAERGLLFLAYQASIQDQFEFLTSAWMNQANRPAHSCGIDLLVGRSRGGRSLPLNGPQGTVEIEIRDETLNWVIPTGGAYLFSPGKAALSRFAISRSLGTMRSVAIPVTAAMAEAVSRGDVGREYEGITTWKYTGSQRELLSAKWPLTRIDTAGSDPLGAFRSLERLDLSGQYFPTQHIARGDLQGLHSGGELHELCLHGVTVSAAKTISNIGRLTRLRELDIRGMDISDSEVMDLAEASPRLEDLSLGTCSRDQKRHCFDSSRLTGGLWKGTARFQHLRRLICRNNNTSDDDIEVARNLLLGLQTLDIGNTNVGDRTIEILAQSRVLRELILDGTRISDEGAVRLSGLAVLNRLNISRTAIGNAGLTQLLSKGQFIALGLSNLSIEDEGLSILRSAKDLEDLDISHTNAGSEAAAAIGALERLSRLRLDYTQVNDADVRLLASKFVRQLSLANLTLLPPTVQALSSNPSLDELTIQIGSDWRGLAGQRANVDLTAAAPQFTEIPPRLRRLTLQGTLTPELRDVLGRLSNLEQLSVTGGGDVLYGVEDSAFQSLRVLVAESAGVDDRTLDRLSRLPNLQELYISDNKVSRSVSRLHLPFLNTLELRNTDVDDTCIEALASLPRLHCLDLPFTRVSPEGISELVKAAKNLQSLALDGAQIIATTVDALSRLSTLVEVYLYGKAVNDDVLKRLQPLSSLRELNLYDTSVTDAAVKVIADFRGLRSLRFLGAHFSAAGNLALAKSRPDIKIYGSEPEGKTLQLMGTRGSSTWGERRAKPPAR